MWPGSNGRGSVSSHWQFAALKLLQECPAMNACPVYKELSISYTMHRHYIHVHVNEIHSFRLYLLRVLHE